MGDVVHRGGYHCGAYGKRLCPEIVAKMDF
jgi:hypothetical protein